MAGRLPWRLGQATTSATAAATAASFATLSHRMRLHHGIGATSAGAPGFAPLVSSRAHMAAAAPLYDLVLLLDSTADDDRRAQILRGVEDAIGKGGEVVNKQDWGMRSLAFEIRHKKDADYHLLQFHGTADLLRQIDRTLRITDEVVRHRIIKLAPGTPPPPDHRPEPRPAGAPEEAVHAVVGGPAEEAEGEQAAPEAAPATGEAAVAEAPPEAEAAPDAGPAADTEAPAPEESIAEESIAEESAPAEPAAGDSEASDAPSA